MIGANQAQGSVAVHDVLVVDVGGSSVKMAMPSRNLATRFTSGHDLTPQRLVAGIEAAVADWDFAAVTIGVPGPVKQDRMMLEPFNLGAGWLGFDFTGAFAVPTKVINDAAMQALGSYEGGKMLFLGLGTGLGAALVVGGSVMSLELAHLPYRDGLSFEDCVATRGQQRFGIDRWKELVADTVARLRAAMVADYVVLGGGHAASLDPLPEGVRRGGNEHAIEGGVRLWQDAFSVA